MTTIKMNIDIVVTLDDKTSIQEAIESMNVTMNGASVEIVDSSVDSIENE